MASLSDVRHGPVPCRNGPFSVLVLCGLNASAAVDWDTPRVIFLYTAQFDSAWLVRVLSVGIDRQIDALCGSFQATVSVQQQIAAHALKQVRRWRGGRLPISSIVQQH